MTRIDKTGHPFVTGTELVCHVAGWWRAAGWSVWRCGCVGAWGWERGCGVGGWVGGGGLRFVVCVFFVWVWRGGGVGGWYGVEVRCLWCGVCGVSISNCSHV